MLGHKTSLSKFKKVEFIPSIFFDPNGIKPEISSSRKTGDFTNMWKLNNTLLNNHSKKKIKMGLENILRQMKMKTTYLNLWGAAKTVLRGSS